MMYVKEIMNTELQRSDKTLFSRTFLNGIFIYIAFSDLRNSYVQTLWIWWESEIRSTESKNIPLL